MKPEAENIQSLTKSVFPRVLLLSSQGLWKMVKIGVTEEKNTRQLWVSASACWDAIRKSEQWEVFAVDYGLI